MEHDVRAPQQPLPVIRQFQDDIASIWPFPQLLLTISYHINTLREPPYFLLRLKFLICHLFPMLDARGLIASEWMGAEAGISKLGGKIHNVLLNYNANTLPVYNNFGILPPLCIAHAINILFLPLTGDCY